MKARRLAPEGAPGPGRKRPPKMKRYIAGDVLEAGPTPGRVRIRRHTGEVFALPCEVVRHSPTGWSWGYGGSGPSDLALNLALYILGGDRARADGIYHSLKWKFIATMDGSPGRVHMLPLDAVAEFCKQAEEEAP